jgi:excisionase family DNA binding protein
MTELENFLSVRQAAQILSVHPETVKRWIWSGQILATKLGNAWFIKRTELEKYKNHYNSYHNKTLKLF